MEELWVVDPLEHRVELRLLVDGAGQLREASALLGLSAADVVAGVDGP